MEDESWEPRAQDAGSLLDMQLRVAWMCRLCQSPVVIMRRQIEFGGRRKIRGSRALGVSTKFLQHVPSDAVAVQTSDAVIEPGPGTRGCAFGHDSASSHSPRPISGLAYSDGCTRSPRPIIGHSIHRGFRRGF
jgi:hypothetical protein